MRECGDCTMCCKLLPISDITLEKPHSVLCLHCDKGCSIYEDRPESCKNFNCVYIEEETPSSMRPDKTHIIFEKITTKIYMGLIDPDYADEWRNIFTLTYLNDLNKDGISVVMTSFKTGIQQVFCAPGHDEKKVIEISLRSAG